MKRIREGVLLKCAERFLEAAAEQDGARWESALRVLAETFRASGASLEIVNAAKDQHQDLLAWMPPSATHLDQYVAEAFHLNPRVAHSLSSPAFTVHFDKQFIDERGMDRHPFYQFMESWRGLRYYLGAEILRTREQSSYLCIHRSLREGHVEAIDVRSFERLLPLLRHAASLYTRLNRASAKAKLADTLLDRLRFAAVLLDAYGRVTEYNEKADSLFLTGALTVRDRRLHCADAAAQREIERAVQRLTSRELVDVDVSPPAIPIRTRSWGRRYLVLLNRLPRTNALSSDGDLRVLALIIDLLSAEQPHSIVGVLADSFGLTPREATVASRVGRGTSLAALADEQKVSIHTLRSQLKSVFAKTAVRRQAELAVLVNRIESSLIVLR